MAKWRKVGAMRLSKSKKVALIGVAGMEPHKWLIVDLDALWDLLYDRKKQIDILEAVD